VLFSFSLLSKGDLAVFNELHDVFRCLSASFIFAESVGAACLILEEEGSLHQPR